MLLEFRRRRGPPEVVLAREEGPQRKPSRYGLEALLHICWEGVGELQCRADAAALVGREESSNVLLALAVATTEGVRPVDGVDLRVRDLCGNSISGAHAIDSIFCFCKCACSMAWRFHAINTTVPP